MSGIAGVMGVQMAGFGGLMAVWHCLSENQNKSIKWRDLRCQETGFCIAIGHHWSGCECTGIARESAVLLLLYYWILPLT
ncbi:hypothetical protein ACFOFO_21015 [Undibacterium arcticum]|uniref:Uncharacterized protein n=1 Tax=Undibacterium arcticum TaxID=1762892 RepID=A0ABV7F895_9BURK